MSYKPSRVMIIREAITKVTQILSGRTIKVIQQGVTAKVDYDPRTHVPVAVYLPMIPDDASDELCDAVQGFLDHEVGHLLHTNHAVLHAATKKFGKEGASILNMVEDLHVEAKQAGMWRGSGSNMQRMGEFYLKRYAAPKLAEARAKGDQKEEMKLLFPSLIRALGGQFIYKEFFEKNAGMMSMVYAALHDLAPKMESIASTEEAVALTEEILKRLGQGGGGGDGEGESDDDGGGQESKDGKGKKSKKPNKGNKDKNKSKSKDKSKGDKSDDGDEGDGDSESGEDESDENGEDPGQGGSDDGESDQDDEGSNEGEGEGDTDGEEGEDEGEEGEGDADGDQDGEVGEGESRGAGPDRSGSDSAGGEYEPPEKSPLSGVNNVGESGGGGATENGKGGLSWKQIAAAAAEAADVSEAIGEELSESAQAAAKTSDYFVYTTDKDEIKVLDVPPRLREQMIESCHRHIEEPVEAMVNPMQKELERAVAARSLALNVGGFRSGRLNGSSLSRLKFNDDRVFKRKTENQTKDVAVSLVVDVSGSMGGTKVLTAARAAFALSLTLDRLRIKHEILCFTTGEMNVPYSEMEALARKGIQLARTESIRMPIIKEMRETLNADVRARMGMMPSHIQMSSNVDGESIEYAAKRLLAQKASRHVMIVLSDGQPAAHSTAGMGTLQKDLRDRVKKIAASKVDVVGIGILTDAVRSYYPKRVILKDVSELPTTVIRELRDLLVPK